MVGGVVVGHANEAAVSVIAPAVEGASEYEGVAIVVAADLHATMSAGVEEDMQLVLAVTDEDDFLFAHARDDEVAGVRDLGLVADEEPAAGEDLLQLLLVDRSVDVDLAADEALLQVDHFTQAFVAAVVDQ